MRPSMLKSFASALLIVATFTLTTPVTHAAPQPARKQQTAVRDGDPIHRLIRAIKKIIGLDQPVIPIP